MEILLCIIKGMIDFHWFLCQAPVEFYGCPPSVQRFNSHIPSSQSNMFYSSIPVACLILQLCLTCTYVINCFSSPPTQIVYYRSNNATHFPIIDICPVRSKHCTTNPDKKIFKLRLCISSKVRLFLQYKIINCHRWSQLCRF